MKKKRLTNQILAANKQQPADLVIRNGRIVNVFTKELTTGDIAITDGVIVGIGAYEGVREIDANGRFVSPGLIDAHVHIESSMVTPHQFSQVVLPHGVTTVITDPHEIANVLGAKGIEFMLKDSEAAMLDVFVMLPSCVPATSFENSGAVLSAEDLQEFINHERVLGIAEVMDFPAVLRADEGMLDKLLLSSRRDGHAAGLKENDLNVYRTAGISTDHECVSKEEMIGRLRRGMYVMLREGSAAKNLKSLLEGVTEANAHRCMFCTDDKHLDDLIEEGSIDHNVRLAIRHGLNPITAISMASLHAAQCYGLQTKGAIAPGYEADLILLDNLEEFAISEVYKKGILAARQGTYTGPAAKSIPVGGVRNSVNIASYTKENLKIQMAASLKANIIGVNPNTLVTEHLIEEVKIAEGDFVSSIETDLLKIAVAERHKASGNIGIGVVKGLGLKRGAIAATVAHDSHNVIAAGTNDEDILTAIKALQSMEGGLVAVKDGEILSALPLAIAGLMSEKDFQQVYEQIKAMNSSLLQLGAPTHFNAFLTLSFLALPVIPHLKITDNGLFHMGGFQHIAVPFSD